MPYRKGALAEGIEPSNRILVVVSPTITIAIAICLDFCEVVRERNPYDELDVDLVLVASMGGPTTLEGHKRRRREFGTKEKWQRSFRSRQTSGGDLWIHRCRSRRAFFSENQHEGRHSKAAQSSLTIL